MTSAIWSWNPVYENVVEGPRRSENGSFWYGMETGVVDIAPTAPWSRKRAQPDRRGQGRHQSGNQAVHGPIKIRKALSASRRGSFDKEPSAWIGSLKASSARSTRERVLKRRSPAGYPARRSHSSFLAVYPAAGRFHPAVPCECGEATASLLVHLLAPGSTPGGWIGSLDRARDAVESLYPTIVFPVSPGNVEDLNELSEMDGSADHHKPPALRRRFAMAKRSPNTMCFACMMRPCMTT